MKKHMKNDIKNNNENNGKQLFELLGDLDENMVEDAWLDHGEEVIIMEERSPFRFVKIAAGIAAAVAIIGGGIYGFNRYRNSVGFSPAASISEDESSDTLSEPEISEPEASEPKVIDHESGVDQEIRDEPTPFMGFGNDQIMSSDVTRSNTDKKPSEILLEDEDIGTIIYCDGFCYFKEPLGIAYDSYNDPEMFTWTGNPDKTDGNSFYGDMPQNNNKYKRLYEGEEMCGLKLKKATTQFKVNAPGESWRIEISPEYETFVEFEGQIEIEGILCVTAPNLSNDGGWYKFYPTEDKLPILGTCHKKVMGYHTAYAHETGAVHVVNEYPYIEINKAFANYDEIDGIDIGDAVYARVTLGNVAYSFANSVSANMDSVEILSEPIAHVDEWMQK